MAPPIPAAKTLRCRQQFTDTDGRLAQTAFYLTYTGSAPTGADLTAMCGVMTVDAMTNLAPLMHISWSVATAFITDLTSPTSAEGESTSGPASGTLTGGRLPASTAAVLANTVARRYRGGHSRMYLPVGDATKLATDDTWDATFLSDVVVAWTGLISDTAGSAWAGAGSVTQTAPSFYDGYTWETYGTPLKYRRRPTPRGTALLDPVITTLGRSTVGTQRRRLRTVG